MAASNLGRTDTRGGRQITEEKVLPLLCHLQKDKEKKQFALYGPAFVHMKTVRLFFIVHHIYRTTGKNV